MAMFGGKGDDKKPADKGTGDDVPLGEEISFSAAGEGHRIWVESQDGRARVMVASNPLPVTERFAAIVKRIQDSSPDTTKKAEPLIAQGNALLAAATPKAELLAQAKERRRGGETVDKDALLADEHDVVSAERALVPILTQLFELMGVGEGESLVDVAAPSGASIRCVKRGNAIVPIGKVAIYPMGLIAHGHEEELRDINAKLQAGEKDQAIRKQLEQRKKEIRDVEIHNYERSQQMWEMVQRAGLSDSVESLNHIISALLDAGAAPTLEQEISVSGAAGHLMVQPIWKTLPTGDRYLSSLIVKGVAPPSS